MIPTDVKEKCIQEVLSGEDYFGAVSLVADADDETMLRVLENIGVDTDMEALSDLQDTAIVDRDAFDRDACAAKIQEVCKGAIKPDDVLHYMHEALMDDERVYAIADLEDVENCNTLVALAKETDYGRNSSDANVSGLFGKLELNEVSDDETPLYYYVSQVLESQQQKRKKAFADIEAAAANIEAEPRQQDGLSL